MDPPGQWTAALKDLSMFTMNNTDLELNRALSRQCAMFEDVRAQLVRKVRETEEAVDREVIKRQAVEEEMRMQKELDAARIAELEALVEALQEEVEGLQRQVLDAQPQSPTLSVPRDEDEDFGDDDDDEEEDLEDPEDSEPCSPMSPGRAEEIEYYKSVCTEAEEQTERANRELEALKVQLLAATAELASQKRTLDHLVSEHDSVVSSLECDLRAREEEIKALREAQKGSGGLTKELAQLRAENEHLRQLATQNIADKAHHDATERALRQAMEDLKNAQKATPELQRKDDMIERLKADFNAIQVRYAKLQASMAPEHVDPASPKVKDQTAAITMAAARKMQGVYDADYATLFDLFYDYEKDITRLQNEILSLQTIIGMREQDVGEEMSSKFARERNELLGQITALQMQLAQTK